MEADGGEEEEGGGLRREMVSGGWKQETPPSRTSCTEMFKAVRASMAELMYLRNWSQKKSFLCRDFFSPSAPPSPEKAPATALNAASDIGDGV